MYNMNFVICDVLTETKLLAELLKGGVKLSRKGRWNIAVGCTREQVDAIMKVSNEFRAW